MPDPVSNAVAALGGGGLMALFVKWLIGREVDRVDKALSEHSASIINLQRDHVGRAEITRWGEKLESTIVKSVDKMDEQFERVHARIDEIGK